MNDKEIQKIVEMVLKLSKLDIERLETAEEHISKLYEEQKYTEEDKSR